MLRGTDRTDRTGRTVRDNQDNQDMGTRSAHASQTLHFTEKSHYRGRTCRPRRRLPADRPAGEEALHETQAAWKLFIRRKVFFQPPLM